MESEQQSRRSQWWMRRRVWAAVRSRPSFLRPLQLNSPQSDSFGRRVALSTAGVLFQGAIRLLTSVLVGRLGGPIALGSVATGISTAQFSTLLLPSTAGSAASKYIARARGKESGREAVQVAAYLSKRAWQGTSLLAFTSAIIWTWVDGGSLGGAICVAMLVVGYSLYNVSRGMQFGSSQVLRATIWDFGCGTLGIAGVVTLLLTGEHGLVVLTPLAVSYIVYGLCNWPWSASGAPDRALRREIDGFIVLGVVGTVASAGFLQISMVLARITQGVAEAGQYAAALALATPVALVAGSLSLVLYPSMSEAWGRGDLTAFKNQTDQATRTLALAMMSAFGALIICSDLIVQLIWGSEFRGGAEVLPVLLLAALINTLGIASTNSLTTQNHRGVVVSVSASLAGLTIGVAAWAILAARMGIIGIGLGYLVGTLFTSAIPIAIVWRKHRHAWLGLWSRVVLGAALAGSMLLLQRALELNPWWGILLSVAFVGAWLGMMGKDVRASVVALRRGRSV